MFRAWVAKLLKGICPGGTNAVAFNQGGIDDVFSTLTDPLCRLGPAAISSDSFAGDEVRYSSEFEALEAELEELNHRTPAHRLAESSGK